MSLFADPSSILLRCVCACACPDGIYTYWDKDSKQRLKVFPAQGNSILTAEFNPAGTLLAYAVRLRHAHRHESGARRRRDSVLSSSRSLFSSVRVCLRVRRLATIGARAWMWRRPRVSCSISRCIA